MRKDASLKVQTGIAKGKTRIQIDSWIKTEIKLQAAEMINKESSVNLNLLKFKFIMPLTSLNLC